MKLNPKRVFCSKVFRKNRLAQQGNVECQNIASSCPVVRCPDAQLLPGACCKSCPSQSSNVKPDVPLLGGGGGLSLGGGGMAMGDEAGKGQEGIFFMAFSALNIKRYVG